MTKSQENRSLKTIDHWVGINEMLTKQKYLSLASFVLSAVLAVALTAAAFRAPIVALSNGEESRFVATERKAVSVGKADIEALVRRFIEYRYEWEDLNEQNVYESLKPLATDGAAKKIQAQLKKEKAGFSGKSVGQYVGGLDVKVTEGAITANFYRILVIMNTPLAVGTTLSFQLVQGERTPWNPAGLYINGIIEHEGAGE